MNGVEVTERPVPGDLSSAGADDSNAPMNVKAAARFLGVSP